MRIQRHQKISSPKREENKEVYKDIQELESVYSNQYQNRLSSISLAYLELKPKLGLLANARERDRKGNIPIVQRSCGFIRRISELGGSHHVMVTIIRLRA